MPLSILQKRVFKRIFLVEKYGFIALKECHFLHAIKSIKLILKTLLSKEGKYVPLSEDYFEFQENLQPHMRKEVADWMLEVCEAERCQPEIFCLAMNYMDRFLCFVKIGQNQLQLLGSVCLLGMISHNNSLITIFGHQNFRPKHHQKNCYFSCENFNSL